MVDGIYQRTRKFTDEERKTINDFNVLLTKLASELKSDQFYGTSMRNNSSDTVILSTEDLLSYLNYIDARPLKVYTLNSGKNISNEDILNSFSLKDSLINNNRNCTFSRDEAINLINFDVSPSYNDSENDSSLEKIDAYYNLVENKGDKYGFSNYSSDLFKVYWRILKYVLDNPEDKEAYSDLLIAKDFKPIYDRLILNWDKVCKDSAKADQKA